MKTKTLLLLLAFTISLSSKGQNADLQKALTAMGTEKLNTLQYSATGKIGALGQSHVAGEDWPLFVVKTYSRTIDYNTMSSSEDLVRTYQDPPAKGGGAPFLNESKQSIVVAGLPSSLDAMEDRHLQLLITPHGFLKQAAKSSAKATKGKGGKSEISFQAGKFKFSGTVNGQGLVEKVLTWNHNHVLGDMLVETTYSDYKDYDGVKLPMRITQAQGGHTMLELLIQDVQPNVQNVNITTPAATPPAAAVVESKKLADWVWFIGGGSHNSILFEFNDHLVVFEGPLHETRSSAVIDEVKKLVPNKPIRYVINSHHHFDHSGGLRTYVAEGATVITSASNKKFYEDAWKTSRTLVPDKLSQNPKKATFVTVKDYYKLTDGTHTIELHLNQGSPHNGAMLIGYLPREKILMVVDDYSPGRLVNGKLVPVAQSFADNLYENIQRLKLDVTTIAPGHGSVVPFSEMVRDVGR